MPRYPAVRHFRKTRQVVRVSLIAFLFGSLLYLATASVTVLAAQSDRGIVWWGGLFPMALSHGIACFWVIRKEARTLGRRAADWIGALTSAALTGLSLTVAVWLSLRVSLSMEPHIALLVLVVSSVIGLFGLALADRSATS